MGRILGPHAGASHHSPVLSGDESGEPLPLALAVSALRVIQARHHRGVDAVPPWIKIEDEAGEIGALSAAFGFIGSLQLEPKCLAIRNKKIQIQRISE